MDTTKINEIINSFPGGYKYHRANFGLLHTDGIYYLAEEAECWWLVDAIASYQPQLAAYNKDQPKGFGKVRAKLIGSDGKFKQYLTLQRHSRTTLFLGSGNTS